MAGSVRSRVCVAVAHLAVAGLVAIGFSAPHPEWFVDGTQPTTPGAIALGTYLAAIATAASAGTPITN